jgi:hypothetical protein
MTIQLVMELEIRMPKMCKLYVYSRSSDYRDQRIDTSAPQLGDYPRPSRKRGQWSLEFSQSD